MNFHENKKSRKPFFSMLSANLKLNSEIGLTRFHAWESWIDLALLSWRKVYQKGLWNYLEQIKVKTWDKITWGNDSFRKTTTKLILATAKVKAKIAGQNHQFPESLFNPHIVKAAPVMGPTMNPMANAMPTIALKDGNYD